MCCRGIGFAAMQTTEQWRIITTKSLTKSGEVYRFILLSVETYICNFQPEKLAGIRQISYIYIHIYMFGVYFQLCGFDLQTMMMAREYCNNIFIILYIPYEHTSL